MTAHSNVRQFALLPDWLRNYQRDWLRPDVIAGLTAAAVVIPKAMAYATIAGLPVQVGLYTAFVPMVIYAVLGSSRPLSVSTTTTLAISDRRGTRRSRTRRRSCVLAQSGDDVDPAGRRLSCRGICAAYGFYRQLHLRTGAGGFQGGNRFGDCAGPASQRFWVFTFARGTFLQNLLATVRQIPHTSLPTLALGIAMLALLVGTEKLFPKAPAPLIAVAAGIAASGLLGLEAHGVELVGRVPSGLPSIAIPDFKLAAQLWPGALGIALMSFTETIAAGRAFAQSGEPSPRANRELFATGLANVGGAFLGSMPAGGGTTQTAVNRLAGARSQVSELVTAAMSLVTMLFLSPLIGLMPHATLAAVVIVYSIGLIKPAEFRDILKIRRTEFIWALTAFAGVMLLGTLKGIVVAIVVSMVMLSHQAADPPVYVLGRKPGTNVFRPLSAEHPEDETFPGLLLLRLDGRFFFANAEHVGQKMKPLVDQAKPKVIALDLSGVPDLEYTALKMLTEAEKRQRERGVSLWIVGLNPTVLQMVQRSPLGEILGREAMHFNVETAVAKYGEMLGS